MDGYQKQDGLHSLVPQAEACTGPPASSSWWGSFGSLARCIMRASTELLHGACTDQTKNKWGRRVVHSPGCPGVAQLLCNVENAAFKIYDGLSVEASEP